MPNTMIISYPETLPDVLRMTREEFESEARLLLAMQLYEGRQLSAEQAAEIAGLDKAAFLDKAASSEHSSHNPAPVSVADRQYELADILDSFPTAADYPEVDLGKPHGEEVW